MKLTITSGKGGTGKTMIATNLAASLSGQGLDVRLMDCDVEAPNDHLFLDGPVLSQEKVNLQVPVVDQEHCTLCNRCADVCEFNAIGVFGSTVLVYPELCHACGGCVLACPESAISEVEHATGVVTTKDIGHLVLTDGVLNIGEAKAPPVIQAVKTYTNKDAINILDSPPGTSCPVVETLRGSDYVVMVTEDSPFGLHDLRLAVELVRHMALPMGLIINKADPEYKHVRLFAKENDIPILLEIPFDRQIAKHYSTGQLIVDKDNTYQALFNELWKNIQVNCERIGCH